MPVLTISERTCPQMVFRQRIRSCPIAVEGNDTVFERVGDLGESKSGERADALVIGNNLGEVEIGEHVPANDEKWFVVALPSFINSRCASLTEPAVPSGLASTE